MERKGKKRRIKGKLLGVYKDGEVGSENLQWYI